MVFNIYEAIEDAHQRIKELKQELKKATTKEQREKIEHQLIQEYSSLYDYEQRVQDNNS